MMLPHQLYIESSCPSCTGILRYPDDMACAQCGWPVIVCTGKPGDGRIEQLNKLAKIRSKDLVLHQQEEQESARLRSQLQDLRSANKQAIHGHGALKEKLAGLVREKDELLKDPLWQFDFDEMERALSDLEQTSKDLAAKLPPKEGDKHPSVTLRCTYDAKANVILAMVTSVRHAVPIYLDLFLAVAISDHFMDHYTEAGIIIPVMNRDKPEMIVEIGQEFRLSLALRPERPAAYHRIIHLFSYTVPKFKIDETGNNL